MLHGFITKGSLSTCAVNYHASLYAGNLAKLYDANLVFLHVYHIPLFPDSNDPSDITKSIAINEKLAIEQMETFTKKFSEENEIPIDRISQRVEYGFITGKILEKAVVINADMIVMGTKGANDLFHKCPPIHPAAPHSGLLRRAMAFPAL